MLKEISFGQFIDLSKQEAETLTPDQLLKILCKFAPRATDRATVYSKPGFIICHSRKLKTLGSNETAVSQKGKALIVTTYKDATNKREIKYYTEAVK